MRIFTAALVTETNTFSPFPTGWPEFEAVGVRWRDTDYRDETAFTECVLHIRKLASADGHDVVLGPSAYANPSGPTQRHVYEHLRDEILQQIESRGPFDLIILTLHGAMVAVDYDDCEGDLLQRVRGLVGPDVFVGAMLDPHCHLSASMVAAADAITIMKEYPHTDGKERLTELYGLGLRISRRQITPVSVLVDCNMIGVWPTRAAPIRALVDRIRERERRDPLLSIGFAHGFPWGDVRDAGTRVLVLANGDVRAAEHQALAVADDIWAERHHARMECVDVEEALSTVATSRNGLLVLADIADNPGGGAPGDSTFILSAALARGLSGIAFAILHDPQALQMCRTAGAGASVELELGGKHGAVSGASLRVRAQVRAIRDDHSQQAPGDGARIPLGCCAWVEITGLHIILSASRYQAVSPDVFTGMGLDVRTLAAVVVKSTQHFRARFEPLASAILTVNTPGALSPDFGEIPYQRRSRPFWPRDPQRVPPRIILRKARDLAASADLPGEP
jgi:microcystin degradation protein MlrC